MDNLTHALVGAALAKTPLGARLSHACLAAALAANLPDVDIVARLYGGPAAYLSDHRGVTHALVGVLALAPLAAWVHWLATRRRGARFADALRLALAALASHPLLDSLNSYGLRPFLPFDGTWYYGDVVFIVDPWLWLILGGAVALAGPRARAGSRGLLLAGAAASALLALYTQSLGVTAAWVGALVALAVARRAGIGRERAGAVLGSSAALAAAYVVAMACASAHARDAGRAWLATRLGAEETPLTEAANPGPLDPRRWRVFLMSARSVHVVEWDLAAGPGEYARLERGEESAFVERALQVDCTAAWRSFARFPHAAVVEDGAGRSVHLMDARYQLWPGALVHVPGAPPRGATWSEAVVRFDDDGRLVGCGD